MNLDDYLAALDTKLRELAGVISSSSIEREIDPNSGIGLLKGQIVFIDGSRFEFVEQLPTERHKFRLHYMNSENRLIVRWDSAPHHRSLSTFPFHKHSAEKIEAHAAITAIEALDEIVSMIKT